MMFGVWLQYVLMFVNADNAHVVRLTELASLERRMASSCSTLLVAPIGVQKGYKKKKIKTDKY